MSAAAKKRPHFSAERAVGMRAFSLVEVVAAIALIAMLAALTVGGLNNMQFLQKKDKPAERALVEAVKSAAFAAKNSEKFVELTYDPRGFFEISELDSAKVIKRVFLKARAQEKFLEAEALGRPADLGEFKTSDEVSFELLKPEIVGDQKMDYPSRPRQSVIFAPDGVCSPFQASVKSRALPEPLVIKFDNIAAAPRGNNGKL